MCVCVRERERQREKERERVCVCTFLLIGPPPDSELKCGRNLSSGQKFSSVVLTRSLPSFLISSIWFILHFMSSLYLLIFFSIPVYVLKWSIHIFSHSNHRPNPVTHEFVFHFFPSNQKRLKYHLDLSHPM